MRARRFVAGCATLLAAACSHSPHRAAPAPSPPRASTSVPATTTSGPPVGNTSSAPGVTAGEIVVGTHQPLTGPTSPGATEIAAGEAAYFRFVNDHGGVHGRSIQLKVVDDQGSPSAAASAVHDLVRDGVFAVIDGRGLATHTASLPSLGGVPDLFIGAPCTCWQAPTANSSRSGFAPSLAVEGAVQGDFLVRTMPGRRVGYLVPADASGTDAVGGLDRGLPPAEVVARQTFDPSAVTVKAELLGLQQAGADVVVLFSTPTVTAAALVEAAQAGYRPTWVVSNSGSDVTTVTSLIQSMSPGGGSLLEGVITDAFLVPADDATNPWIELFRKVRDVYAPKVRFDGYVTYGMAVAYSFVQGAQAAGQNPTRSSLLGAVASLSAAGPGLSTPAFGPPTRAGYDAVEMGTIAVGQFRPAGPPMTVTSTGAVAPAPAPVPAVPPAPPSSGPSPPSSGGG